MRKYTLSRLREKYFHKDLDFRVRIFNTLAFIGIAAGIVFCAVAFVTDAGVANALANLAASAVAVFLLLFANRTGRYQLCFLITVIAVFIVLFPVIFFTSGGYHSGMPAFFVFAAVFTVLMLEGKRRIVVTLIEIALYVSICLFAYRYPATVNAFASEEDMTTDIISGFILASLALAFAVGQHIIIYDRERKRLERLDREKTELFGNISHEMKTPLAVLSSLAHTMRTKFEKIPQAQEAVADAMLIAAEADRLAMLVSQVLELTRVEEGRMVREKAPCHIDEIIHRAMAAHFAVSGNGNRIDIQIDGKLPPLLADAPRIGQAVANLAANADRHTRGGHIVISASRAGAFVRVSVKDDGCGMEKEMLPLIFERYYTGAGDTGTGLGLYICKHIIEAHGGKISVDSAPGKGSDFVFTLPVYNREPVT
jgi:signal transduction histidine kinase